MTCRSILQRWLQTEHDTTTRPHFTYNPNNQLIACIIPPHQQGVINDKVAGQEVGVAVYSCSQNGLAVGADVQWIVMDQLEKVLIQKDHLTAFLPRVCFHFTVPQGAF